jgi:hypothetical protein
MSEFELEFVAHQWFWGGPLLCRLSDAGPVPEGTQLLGPASETLHKSRPGIAARKRASRLYRPLPLPE